jgi:RNA polymerase sigma-70 factor (ECF subfamily)
VSRASSQQDGRLVAAALAGRRDALVGLYQRHYGSAVRLIAAWCDLDGLERLTLAEEAFARAFAGLPRLKEPARFQSSLLVQVRQAAQSRAERRRGQQPFVGEPERAVELAPDPGEALARAEARALVEGVPSGQRTLAQQFYLDGGVSLSELAARAGIPPAAAEKQLEALRARLKLKLAVALVARRAPLGGSSGQAPRAGAHLRRESWEKILRGERIDGEDALALHLASPCEVCEQRIAERPGADGLDGDVDRAFLSLSRRAALFPSTASFERVVRRMRLDSRAGARGALALPPLRPGMALPLSLAGLLALAGLSALMLQRVPPSRSPSPERAGAPEVELAFSAVAASAGRGEAVPGHSGERLSEDQELLLQYHLARPAFVTMFRVWPDGRAEVLAQPGRVGSGSHALAVNEDRMRVSLRGARGANRFAALATEAPLLGNALRAALEALERGAAPPGLGTSVAIDEFEIAVSP